MGSEASIFQKIAIYNTYIISELLHICSWYPNVADIRKFDAMVRGRFVSLFCRTRSGASRHYVNLPKKKGGLGVNCLQQITTVRLAGIYCLARHMNMKFWDEEDLNRLKKCFILVTDAPDDENVVRFMALLDRPRKDKADHGWPTSRHSLPEIDSCDGACSRHKEGM